jgi:hypothetical protein
MARWVLVNSITLADQQTKFWYWIHTSEDNAEARGGPFESLMQCIAHAKRNGLPIDDALPTCDGEAVTNGVQAAHEG